MAVADELVKGVTRKMNGWIEIETDRRRYGTKKEDLGREALAKVGEVVSFEYHSRDGNTNPHTGQPYQNYYWDGIVDKAPALEIPPEIPQAGAPVGRKTDPDDAWRMALSTGAKLAVQTMPLMPREECTPENQQRIALWWAAWIFSTQRPEAQVAAPVTARAPGAYDEPGSADFGPPPHADDDIPF